jgi:hypothetical protein
MVNLLSPILKLILTLTFGFAGVALIGNMLSSARYTGMYIRYLSSFLRNSLPLASLTLT